jgi:hypothetical protein
MINFLQNLPHLLMAALVIAAATVLASVHVITGGEAIALIGAAGGFSLGGAVGYASASGAATTASVTTSSTGESTVRTSPASTPPAPVTTNGGSTSAPQAG